MGDNWAYLEVSEDKMQAWLTLTGIQDEDTVISEQSIEEFLRMQGVKTGFLMDEIQKLAEEKPIDTPTLVAEGKKPEHGKDGDYYFSVPMEDAKAKPVVNPDGSVDYINSLKLAMVSEGDLIAAYIPPTPGMYGFNIYSEMLAPMKGKELRPLAGSGFAKKEDSNEYYARVSGRIYKDGDRVMIDPVYTVKGDLDLETGNIRFNGDVEVTGDVRSGLTIEAEGNIFINGHVGGCTLMATKNVTIRKGVQGREKCVIVAGGDVACSFVERCTINAQGIVYADSILSSEVFARKKVVVSTKRGMIIGGKVQAGQEVVAKNVGNDTGVTTLVLAGVVPDAVDALGKLNPKLLKMNQELTLLESKLEQYDKIEAERRTEEMEAVRMKILRAKVVLTTDQKKLLAEMASLNEEIQMAKRDGRVRVTGIVYEGVRISIGKTWYDVKESSKDVSFVLKKEEVAMIPGEEE